MTFQYLLLLCCTLTLVESLTPHPVPQKNKHNNCFRLTRSTRTRVQQVLKKYREEQLGNKHVDRSLQLNDLPILSMDFDSWLNLTDWDRLHAAFLDMQTYWNRLERKRKQLESEEGQGPTARPTLPGGIRNIQLDLRDLMSQVSSQMSNMRSSWKKPHSPPHVGSVSPSKTWDSLVEGYIILRDLDLYLIRLARDFLLLASKTQ